MYTYDETCLKTFLKNQSQLFDGDVASSMEEADVFLEDSMAVIVDSIEEVQSYFEEEGMDTSGLSLEELSQASEVFSMPDGRYLIVEG